VGRVQIASSPRGQNDYPRRLTIESIDRLGAARTIFDDGIVDRLIEGLAVDERHAPVIIDMPDNMTSTLRIRQTGHGPSWWSIHELTVWERRR
jgi:hypothetical protein